MIATQGLIPMLAPDEQLSEMLSVGKELRWSEPVPIKQSMSKYWVQKALATRVFWNNYKKHKQMWRNLGFIVQKQNQQWVVVRTHIEPPFIPKGFGNIESPAERRASMAVSTIVQIVDMEAYNAIPGVNPQSVKESASTESAIHIPSPVGCIYLPYQKAGIQLASSRECGTLIADEMGLGKTIQALGVINNLSDVHSVLVICPAAVKIHWVREAEKWLVEPRSLIVIGPKTKWDVPQEGPVFVVINYDQLKKYYKELRSRVWDLTVLDEAHYIKNLSAQRTSHVIGSNPLSVNQRVGANAKIPARLTPIRSRRKLALTGTPVTTNVQNLWPIISWLNPEYWGQSRDFASYQKFMKRYTEPNMARLKTGREIIIGYDSKNLTELQQKLRSSVMVRRRKDDVLKDLPPKLRRTIVLELATKDEREALSEESKLVQSMVGARLKDIDVDFQQFSSVRRQTAVAKAPRVAEYIVEALEESSPIVYYEHHRDAINIVADILKSKKISCGVYTGSTPQNKRQEIVDGFQDGKIDVFLGSMEAAGIGITLTRSSRVIFGELSWSAATMAQAEDRVHRIGQAHNVLIEHIVLDGSLDAKISRRIQTKLRIAEDSLGLSRSSDIAQTQIGVDDDFDIALEWLVETKSDDRLGIS